MSGIFCIQQERCPVFQRYVSESSAVVSLENRLFFAKIIPLAPRQYDFIILIPRSRFLFCPLFPNPRKEDSFLRF